MSHPTPTKPGRGALLGGLLGAASCLALMLSMNVAPAMAKTEATRHMENSIHNNVNHVNVGLKKVGAKLGLRRPIHAGRRHVGRKRVWRKHM